MIYYCVLISFAVVHVLAVGQGSAVSLIDYYKEVEITNTLIENAHSVYVPNAGQKHLNFMLAVPDYVNRYFDRYIKWQDKMQYEIISAIGIDRPTAKENPVESLKSLGDKRRRMTRKAIKNLLFKEMMKKTFYPHGDFTLVQKCFFIGLAMSTINAIDFTKTVTIQNNACVTTSMNDVVHKYIEFENHFWEVECDEVNVRKKKFLEQLNELD